MKVVALLLMFVLIENYSFASPVGRLLGRAEWTLTATPRVESTVLSVWPPAPPAPPKHPTGD